MSVETGIMYYFILAPTVVAVTLIVLAVIGLALTCSILFNAARANK